MCSFAETTHTPQGDGNIEHFVLALHHNQKQPTPRKGTETPHVVDLGVLVAETTHTPQGDGNLCVLAV